MNNQSNFLNIISGVTQGSNVGQFFFNISTIDLFSAWARKLSDLIRLLECGSNIVVNWFT